MRIRFFERLLYLCGILSILSWGAVPMAQEDTYDIAHQDVFRKMNRPPVTFPHALHEEALSEEGCGVCHHVFDEQKGRLVYIEDEEEECKGCHGLHKVNEIRALREAYHKSCTGCHRKMIKQKILKTGPSTCGECHLKQSMIRK